MSARERERARLVSLAAMHCRHCLTHSHTDNNDTYTEPEVDVDPDSLASLTRQLLRHSRLQLRRAEQLLATLRAGALLDQHQHQEQEQHQHQDQDQEQKQEQDQGQCCGLAEELQRSARRRLATLRRCEREVSSALDYSTGRVAWPLAPQHCSSHLCPTASGAPRRRA